VCDSVHFAIGVEPTWGELKRVLVLVLVLGQDLDLKEMKKFMTNSGGCLVLLLLLLGWRQADRQAGDTLQFWFRWGYAAFEKTREGIFPGSMLSAAG
jgi:hypothetical protein